MNWIHSYCVVERIAKTSAVRLDVEEGEDVNDGKDEAEEELFRAGGTRGCFLKPQPNGHEEPVTKDNGPDQPAVYGGKNTQSDNSSTLRI